MLVGEQPGDEEDRQGLPFVGPAGRVLDRALADAGLLRDDVYVTNAVKHFKWEPRGKRRLHKTPAQAEIAACQDWLDQEISMVAPRVIVALGGDRAAGPARTTRIDRQGTRNSPSACGGGAARRHLSPFRDPAR